MTLVFNGVDYDCQVWLNGQKIGNNAGMFRRFTFDITDVVKVGETNRLYVQIERMPAELLPYIINSDGPDIPYKKYWFLSGIELTRKTLKDLKTPGNFSFDWSTNVWALGIWKNVWIDFTGPARIEWVRVQSKLSDNFTKANVTASMEVNSLADTIVNADFSIKGNGVSVSKQIEIDLKKGKNLITADIPMDNPALWWPNGHGEQPLYVLHSELKSSDNKSIDARATNFGIRELKWVHTEGAPEDFVSRYQLLVNGRPIRTIGSGLILPSVFPGCGLSHKLDLLKRAKFAGMNTIRINGGGMAPGEDEWYDMADSLGIMISYEYPICNIILSRCDSDLRDPEFLKNLEFTCRNLIKQTRNHPSIIEYVGGNEHGWAINTIHPALQVMEKAAAEENDRIFRATSPDAGATHSPWMFDIRSTYKHYNGIPKANGSPENNKSGIECMRYDEFGSCSPAVEEVWYRDIPVNSQWPIKYDDDILCHKNGVRAVFNENMWLNKADIDRDFGTPYNLPDYIRAGQYLGAEGLRYAFDANRRKGRRYGGITNHCFSEPWPNIAGSGMVDFDGRTYMNYDFVKQALATISLSLEFDSVLYSERNGIKAKLFVTSDAPAPVKGLRWNWIAYDYSHNVLAQRQGTSDINPIEVKELMPIELNPKGNAAKCPVFVEMSLNDADGKLLTERIQIFASASVEGPFKGLMGFKSASSNNNTDSELVVKRTTLQVRKLATEIEGEEETVELLVKNTGEMTALFCEPHPMLFYRTDLYIDNNNCFIPPGESRIISIHAPRKSDSGLSLDQTGWRISTWNADDVFVQPNEVILSLGRTDKLCREFAGYFGFSGIKDTVKTECLGNHADAGNVWYKVSGSSGTANFTFDCSKAQTQSPTMLRIHTSDQSSETTTVVEININGKIFEKTLPKGLGIQSKDPSHLAFPATLEFDLDNSYLHQGKNQLSVRVKGNGWFTWDSLDWVSSI